jgi:PEP-CTERM motif
MLRFPLSLSVRKFLTISSLCLAPVAMQANTIFSENFETATIGLGVTTAGLFATINGTNVDLLGPGNYGLECLSPESGNCVDLSGTGGNLLGDLVTSISIPSAGTYSLSFDLVGNSFNPASTSTTVNFGSGYSQTFILPPQDTVDGIVVDVPVAFASAGTYTLEFLNNGPTSGTDLLDGGILDNVSVNTISPVPEPTTFLLLGSALMLGSLIRKRVVR